MSDTDAAMFLDAVAEIENEIGRDLTDDEVDEMLVDLYVSSEPVVNCNGAPCAACAAKVENEEERDEDGQFASTAKPAGKDKKKGKSKDAAASKSADARERVADHADKVVKNAFEQVPRCPETGHWMPVGSGTGRGEAHRAAQAGHKDTTEIRTPAALFNEWKPVKNAFCPTGAGGGQDNSCSAAGGSGGGRGSKSDGERFKQASADTDKRTAKADRKDAVKSATRGHKIGEEFDHPEFGRVRVTEDGIEPAASRPSRSPAKAFDPDGWRKI